MPSESRTQRKRTEGTEKTTEGGGRPPCVLCALCQPLCPRQRRWGAVSVPQDGAEVQSLQDKRSLVVLDQIAEIQRPVTRFHADVVREVDRAVHVDVHVVRVVPAVDAVG